MIDCFPKTVFSLPGPGPRSVCIFFLCLCVRRMGPGRWPLRGTVGFRRGPWGGDGQSWRSGGTLGCRGSFASAPSEGLLRVTGGHLQTEGLLGLKAKGKSNPPSLPPHETKRGGPGAVQVLPNLPFPSSLISFYLYKNEYIQQDVQPLVLAGKAGCSTMSPCHSLGRPGIEFRSFMNMYERKLYLYFH